MSRPTIVRWLATALILLGGLLCLLLALGAHLQLLEARKLMSQGQQVEGTVTERRAGGRRSSRYSFSYTYPAGNIAHTKANLTIGYRTYTRLSSGQTIPVWYDPTDPERSITAPELADYESLANRLFFPAAALALLVWAIRRMLRGRLDP